MASKPNVGGRPSIYPGKDLTRPVRGFVTPSGREMFESARRRVAKAAGHDVAATKDGDVIEALVIGMERALEHIRRRFKKDK